MPNKHFTLVNVDQYAPNLAQLNISSASKNNTLNLQKDEVLPGTNLDMVYFLAVDEIFTINFYFSAVFC